MTCPVCGRVADQFEGCTGCGWPKTPEVHIWPHQTGAEPLPDFIVRHVRQAREQNAVLVIHNPWLVSAVQTVMRQRAGWVPTRVEP